MLEHHGPDEADNGFVVGENANYIGAALHLGIQSLQWIGAVDLDAVGLRKAHEGQDLVLSVVHHGGEFGKLRPQLVRHGALLRAGRFRAFPHEDGVDHGQDGLALAFADVSQGVADELHAAALPARL